MNKASYVGTVPLEFLDRSSSNWGVAVVDDIIISGLIKQPKDYLLTLGSGVYSWGSSLATTPAYQLPTNSQYYLAGRDVFRWGGTADPYEIDFDRYGFTPDFTRGAAIVWKAPKSEPHHLTEVPELLTYIPKDWRDIFEAVLDKKLP